MSLRRDPALSPIPRHDSSQFGDLQVEGTCLLPCVWNPQGGAKPHRAFQPTTQEQEGTDVSEWLSRIRIFLQRPNISGEGEHTWPQVVVTETSAENRHRLLTKHVSLRESCHECNSKNQISIQVSRSTL